SHGGSVLRPPSLPPRPLFPLTVLKLARARRPDLVDRLLSDPKSPESEGFMIRLISRYSAAGMPDHAAAAPSTAYQTSDKSLSALLSDYFHNRLFDLIIARPLTVHRGNSVLLLASSLIVFCFDLCVKKVILKPPAMCSTK
ncbi:hypothetical protein BHE74_00057323, partial [Ensete ventricosum]